MTPVWGPVHAKVQRGSEPMQLQDGSCRWPYLPTQERLLYHLSSRGHSSPPQVLQQDPFQATHESWDSAAGHPSRLQRLLWAPFSHLGLLCLARQRGDPLQMGLGPGHISRVWRILWDVHCGSSPQRIEAVSSSLVWPSILCTAQQHWTVAWPEHQLPWFGIVFNWRDFGCRRCHHHLGHPLLQVLPQPR